jgi:hypothetical protein
MTKIFRNYYGLILVLVFCWWAVAPILKTGFFPMHDDTQVARVFEMAKALKDGQFPVRYVSDLGYGFGYPIFNFYSPLPYYFGAVFIILGLDSLLATKIMFIFGIVMAGVFMYLLSREFWGEMGGAIGGLFLVYAPYHAVQIYVRGAVGEFWALTFIPLFFLGVYKIYKILNSKYHKDVYRWVLLGALGYAGVILSHNISAMILTLFLIPIVTLFSYLTVKKGNLFAICYLLFAIFLGLSLSAFFWLPAILEAKFVNVESLIEGTNDFHLHFLCLGQLWDSSWGYGGSNSGCLADGLSFKIGKIYILLTLVALILSGLWWTKDKLRSRLVLFAICYLLFTIFLTLEVSQPIWEAFPPLAFAQYPWRLLTFIILSASFLSGAVFSFIKNNLFKIFAFVFLLFILLFYNVKYFQPQTYLNVSENYYINDEALKWRTSKVSDEYLPRDFPRPANYQEAILLVDTFKNKHLEYDFKANTPIRTIANLVSLSGLSLIIGGAIYARQKKS